MGTSARKGCRNQLISITWNIEGLTDIKLYEIYEYMKRNSVDIACIQETRKTKSDTYVTSAGYEVFLSGSGDAQREWAGVGFIVAPHFRKFVIGFAPNSNRICSLKIKVSRGCSAVFCAYAPHNLKPLEERLHFYEELHLFGVIMAPPAPPPPCQKYG